MVVLDDRGSIVVLNFIMFVLYEHNEIKNTSFDFAVRIVRTNVICEQEWDSCGPP